MAIRHRQAWPEPERHVYHADPLRRSASPAQRAFVVACFLVVAVLLGIAIGRL